MMAAADGPPTGMPAMTGPIGSFYVTGGTLRPVAPSYVERQADRDLYQALGPEEFYTARITPNLAGPVQGCRLTPCWSSA